MIDPAMIQWNPNPEMFPNQPVGLPNYTFRIASDPPHAFDPYTAQVVADPPAAFNPPPAVTNTAAQTGSNWQVPTPEMQPFSRATPEPQRTFAPSFGPMQDLALQMGQYGAPSGYRAPSQMGVTPYNPGGGSGGGYDGADVDRPNTDTIPPAPPPGGVADPGMGGGGIPNNNTWFNDLDGYVNWATGNNPMFPTPVGSNPFSGVDWGNVAGNVGAGLNALVNPLGALVNAITNRNNEPEEETADHSQPPASTGSTATGGSPYIPWLGNEGPQVINDLNNQPIGNVNTTNIEQIIRRITPRFTFNNLTGR